MADTLAPGGILMRICPMRLHGWVGLCKTAVSSWLDDRAPTMGAAIAYYGILPCADARHGDRGCGSRLRSASGRRPVRGDKTATPATTSRLWRFKRGRSNSTASSILQTPWSNMAIRFLRSICG
jgi:hypothetical protein